MSLLFQRIFGSERASSGGAYCAVGQAAATFRAEMRSPPRADRAAAGLTFAGNCGNRLEQLVVLMSLLFQRILKSEPASGGGACCAVTQAQLVVLMSVLFQRIFESEPASGLGSSRARRAERRSRLLPRAHAPVAPTPRAERRSRLLSQGEHVALPSHGEDRAFSAELFAEPGDRHVDGARAHAGGLELPDALQKLIP